MLDAEADDFSASLNNYIEKTFSPRTESYDSVSTSSLYAIFSTFFLYLWPKLTNTATAAD
jgi:hypothetical protein